MGVPSHLPDSERAAMAGGSASEPVVDQVAETIAQEDVPVSRSAALIEEALKPVEPEVVEPEVVEPEGLYEVL